MQRMVLSLTSNEGKPAGPVGGKRPETLEKTEFETCPTGDKPVLQAVTSPVLSSVGRDDPAA